MKHSNIPQVSFDRLRLIDEQQFDIRIATDGRWFHKGDEIRRIEMVKLFASVLMLDEVGDYWLVTPVEKGRITVDDAPFIVCEMLVSSGAEPRTSEIHFRTNLDENIALDAAHPILLRPADGLQQFRPYIEVRNGLLAKLSRPVYYQLAERAEEGPDGRLGVWSHQQHFALEL
ncbi:DUF1285 domain-containing protein [Candidatus Puniceispirillum sp.]|nr:DUF1285 domain-containing protein [Candidatus Puniceispirillum sp.]